LVNKINKSDDILFLKERISELETDIQKHKELHEEILQTAEMYKLITENTSDSIAILTFDKHLKYIYVNSTGKNEQGLSSKFLIGKSFLKFIHPSDKPYLESLLTKYLKIINDSAQRNELPDKQVLEFRMQANDGGWRYMRSTINSIENNILAVSKDITDLKEIENKLRNNKKHAEKLLNIAAGIIVSLDKDGNITLLNDSGYKLLGFKKKELIGKNWFDSFLPKNIRLKMKSVFNDLMKDENSKVEHYVNKIITKDGEVKTINWHNTILRNKTGEISGILSGGIDITDMIHTQNELRKSEKNFKNWYDTSPDMHFSVNIDGTILSVNKYGANYLGYKLKELIGRKIWNVVYKKDLKRVKIHIINIINNCNKEHEIEFRKIRKDGSIIYVQERIQCICNSSGMPKELIIVCRDITEREKSRQQIIDYQENLKSMTYELNTIEEKTRKQLANWLHDDVSQAMALSKITLSSITPNMSYDDINDKIKSVNIFLTNAIKSSRDLTYELSPPILHELGLSAAVMWYTNQISKLFKIKFQISGVKKHLDISEDIRILLYKVIVELSNNIIKHSGASLVTITISQFKSFIRVIVRDNGVGFDSKSQQILSKEKKFGLFSIRERINYIGGEFKIDSKIKKGTQVVIKIQI